MTIFEIQTHPLDWNHLVWYPRQVEWVIDGRSHMPRQTNTYAWLRGTERTKLFIGSTPVKQRSLRNAMNHENHDIAMRLQDDVTTSSSIQNQQWLIFQFQIGLQSDRLWKCLTFVTSSLISNTPFFLPTQRRAMNLNKLFYHHVQWSAASGNPLTRLG